MLSGPLAYAGGALSGAAAGFLAGLLGIGGGGVLAPLLTLLVGAPQHVAQGLSLGAMLPPVGYPALRAYRQAGVSVRWPLVGALIVAFLVGAPLGSWLALHLAARPLRIGFSAFLIVNAIRTARKKPARPADAAPPPAVPSTPLWGLPIGLLAGTLSGLLGIGGGLVVLPALARLGYGRLEAQAVSVAMMLPPIGLPAVLVYGRGPEGLPLPLLAAVVGGFVLGNGLGGRAATAISEERARTVSLVLFTALAAFMAFHA